MIYAVTKPPDVFLDCNSKCTACGIDWSKMIGAVEIFHVEPGVNADGMNRVFEKAMDVRKTGTINENSTDDHLQTPRRIAAASVPTFTPTSLQHDAQPSSSVNINMSIIDDLLHEPARLNEVSILKSRPEIVISVMQRFFEDSSERNSTSLVPVNVPLSKNIHEQLQTTSDNNPLVNSNDDDEII